MVPWTTFLIPALMATVGAGALVTSVGLPEDTAGAGQSRVWIDGPSGESALPPGKIQVTAHATADDMITGLDLFVDGKKVTNDKTLVRNEKLVYGGFTWDADVGTHKLVVQQLGGTGEKSLTRIVVISQDAPEASEATTPSGTTLPGPAETTTTVGSVDTTTSAPPEVSSDTIAPPETSDTVPATAPSQTTEPAPDGPVIEGTTLVGTSGNQLAISYCDFKVTVTAQVRNAEYVQVIVAGTGFDQAMSQNGESYSLRLDSDPNIWDAGDVGSHEVTVLAGRGDAVVDRSAGTIEIRENCPKD